MTTRNRPGRRRRRGKTATALAIELIEIGIPRRSAADLCGVSPQSIDGTLRYRRRKEAS